MSLTSNQATEALREIEAVAHRSGQLYRYQRSAPILMLWGIVWLIGFGLTDAFPEQANSIWLPLDAIGVIASVYLGARGKGRNTTKTTWRWLASVGSIFAFYVLALIIFRPATGAQSAALISLIVSLCYVLGGCWIGVRFAITGVLLALLTLFGLFALPAHFFLWMAVFGGGALMMGGLWLRRV